MVSNDPPTGVDPRLAIAEQGDQSALSELLAEQRERLRRMIALRLDRRLQAPNTAAATLVATLPADNSTNVAFSRFEFRIYCTGDWSELYRVPRELAIDLPQLMAFAPDGNLLAVDLNMARILLLDSVTRRQRRHHPTTVDGLRATNERLRRELSEIEQSSSWWFGKQPPFFPGYVCSTPTTTKHGNLQSFSGLALPFQFTESVLAFWIHVI